MPSLADLARTNHILAELREPLSAGQDVFVKWSQMEAFNGACLRRDQGGTEVYFLEPSRQRIWEQTDIICRLPRLVVVVRPIGWSPDAGLHQAIANADAGFVANTSSFSRVSRLVLSLMTSDVPATVVSLRHLASDLGAEQPRLELFESPVALGEVDAELVFAEPVHDQVVRDRLAMDFPGLPADPIFGAGVLWRAVGAGDQARPRISWATIFARQY